MKALSRVALDCRGNTEYTVWTVVARETPEKGRQVARYVGRSVRWVSGRIGIGIQ